MAKSELQKSGEILNQSAIYQTQAWGEKNQADFYNAVIRYKTNSIPTILLKQIKKYETAIGRKKTYKWGPREIDIDILFCDGISVNLPDLKIPHTAIINRKFVLQPMAELDRNYIIPGTDKTISNFLEECPDNIGIQKLNLSW